MTRNDVPLCRCEGWWEQDWFGRQPMTNLFLTFDKRRIQGSGSDLIGPFVLSGIISEDGRVVIQKRYIERHRVDYLGVYDGEGLMSGEWRLGDCRGRWLIKICRVETDSKIDVVELVPGR